MGITIHWRLGQKKEKVKEMLDAVQSVAIGIQVSQALKIEVPFIIRRLADDRLFIDIGDCDTLAFEFKSYKEIKEAGEKSWDYDWQMIKDVKDAEPLWWASGFCKTQYAKTIVEHRWVADILRACANLCVEAQVTDEGGYYHSGKIADAEIAIEENGVLIDSLSGMLSSGKMDVIKGGETRIRRRRKK